MFGETKRIIDFLNKHHLDTGRALMLLPFAITHTHTHTYLASSTRTRMHVRARVASAKKKIHIEYFWHTDIPQPRKQLNRNQLCCLLPMARHTTSYGSGEFCALINLKRHLALIYYLHIRS